MFQLGFYSGLLLGAVLSRNGPAPAWTIVVLMIAVVGIALMVWT